MTGKADFNDAEWKLLREAPTSAGMIVMEADRGGAIRETFSMAKAYTEARTQPYSIKRPRRRRWRNTGAS
jgi:hypothetical protein